MHWAVKYIGIPWQRNADGPAAYDCWNFFRLVQRERFGLLVPPLGVVINNVTEQLSAFGAHEERRHWQSTEQPQEGDAVLLARSRHPVHIGLWVNANSAGGVLHSIEGEGSVFQTPAKLAACAWGRLTYYRRATCS